MVEQLDSAQKESGLRFDTFQSLSAYQETSGKTLGPKDLGRALHLLQFHYAAQDRCDRNDFGGKILIFTAYSEDYSIGRLCEHANRRYAASHGYEFESVVRPFDDMIAEVAPRQFLGWYKVLLLNDYLTAQRQKLEADNVKWLFWIDADAVIIDHEKPIEQLLQRAQGRELCIGEDASTACLVNTGVLAVRVCDWSASLWSEVWEQRRFFTRLYYEQSSLIKCLARRLEGLDLVHPFHSYLEGGPRGVKLFPHVCCFPMSEINSNIDKPGAFGTCQFIFHALGRGNKLGLLIAALNRRGLLTGDAPSIESFRLLRGKCGAPPSERVLKESLLWGKREKSIGGKMFVGADEDAEAEAGVELDQNPKY